MVTAVKTSNLTVYVKVVSKLCKRFLLTKTRPDVSSLESILMECHVYIL
jgi:hypothetical protein